MGELVSVEIGDGSASAPAGVATIRLDRPPMNALNSQMQDELRDAARQVSADDAVRAVVIYGGTRCSPRARTSRSSRRWRTPRSCAMPSAVSSTIDALARIPKPVIAAVTGYALGGGCELALTADFRVSAENAKWGQPEILLGIIPGMGGTQRLPRLIGPARAKDLIYTGRFVDAGEALGLGLVDVVVPAEDVYSTALGMAAAYANGPALALAGSQGGHRRRPGHRPGQRAAPRVAPVRLAVRDCRSQRRHAVVHRERPRQGRVHRELTLTAVIAEPARQRRAGRGGLARPEARQHPVSRLGGHELRREVVDLLRRAVHRLCTRPLHLHRGTRRLAVRQRRSNSAAAPASSCSTSSWPA